ncbi:hypothetical protein [Streptomyces filamentosus]|uniref:hypothetical protein n=1 Tax=Streptomyces filamentosus TaxID=67294 RepID=UPI0037D9649D
MSFWIITAVVGAAALPQLLRKHLPGRRVRRGLAPLVAASVAVGLSRDPQAWGPALFACVLSIGFLLEGGRHRVMDDYEYRIEHGMPPLMKRGDPYTRGLFDSVWLIRYRLGMRKHPIPEEQPPA